VGTLITDSSRPCFPISSRSTHFSSAELSVDESFIDVSFIEEPFIGGSFIEGSFIATDIISTEDVLIASTNRGEFSIAGSGEIAVCERDRLVDDNGGLDDDWTMVAGIWLGEAIWSDADAGDKESLVLAFLVAGIVVETSDGGAVDSASAKLLVNEDSSGLLISVFQFHPEKYFCCSAGTVRGFRSSS